MLEEKRFRRRPVVTSVCLRMIVCLIVFRGSGFLGGLDWCALMTITISNHYDDVLGDGFVGVDEFSLLCGRDTCVIDGAWFMKF